MAKLNIDINAKNNSNSALDAVEKKVGGLSGMFKKFAGGLGAIFGVTMAKDTLQEWIDGLAQIGHEASRIGMTTDELQRLKSVASKNKVDPDMMIGGIEKMATIVDDALQGNEQAIDKFKRLGIAMDELKGKSVYEQFTRIADGINSMSTATEKTSMARDMFGKLGGKLVELISNYKELGEAFDKSGRMIDEKTVEQAEKFERTMKSLGGTFKATFLQSGVVEYLAELVQALKEAMDLANGIDKNKVKGAYGDKTMNTVQQFNEHTGYNWLLRKLGINPEGDGEVLRLDAPPRLEVQNKRARRLNDIEKQKEQSTKAANVKQEYADRDYNKAIAKLNEEIGLNEGIADSKKAIAEAQKIINDLEAKGNKLTFAQMSNIFDKTKAIQDAKDKAEAVKKHDEAKKSIQDEITALDEKLKIQNLVNIGKSKEAFIAEQMAQAEKTAKDKSYALSEDEKNAIKSKAGSLYDAQELNKFKGSQGAIVNDRFSSVGGMGGKMFSQDTTPKIHLEVARTTQKSVAKIEQAATIIANNSSNGSALRAP